MFVLHLPARVGYHPWSGGMEFGVAGKPYRRRVSLYRRPDISLFGIVNIPEVFILNCKVPDPIPFKSSTYIRLK